MMGSGMFMGRWVWVVGCGVCLVEWVLFIMKQSVVDVCLL